MWTADPGDDPARQQAFNGLASIVAGMLEDGSVRAARAGSANDAAALRQLGEDVAVLAAAMGVLVRPGA